MLLDTLATARDLGRLHEIVRVFASNGASDVLHRLGLFRFLKSAGLALHVPRASRFRDPNAPERMRHALESLGPTFVKLGQLLSGRTDLLPPEWTTELALLREHAAEVPWESIRAQLAEDLSADPELVFLELDPRPIAAASIAQVHRARLGDGTPVALKIRRPGIVPIVEADLRLLARMAELVEEREPELCRYRPRALVRELQNSLRAELDLSQEARQMSRIASRLGGRDDIVVPRVFGGFTTKRLLVQEFLDGPSLDDWIAAGTPGGIDPRAVARVGADVVLEMVFVHGHYHADPHGGNVIVLRDGRIGLIDFGMVGRLSPERRREFQSLLSAAVQRRDSDVVTLLAEWAAGAEVDESMLAQDVALFLDRYDGASVKDIDVGALLRDVAALIRENELALPSDVALLLKVFVTLDGLGMSLDPGFQLVAAAEPFVTSAAMEERSPLARLRHGLGELGSVLGDLPRGIRPLLSQWKHGKLRLEIDVRRLDDASQLLQHSLNRLTIGLVTSALIVGTSIALTVPSGATIAGLPAFAFLGFTSSLVLGVGLLVAIGRSR